VKAVMFGMVDVTTMVQWQVDEQIVVDWCMSRETRWCDDRIKWWQVACLSAVSDSQTAEKKGRKKSNCPSVL